LTENKNSFTIMNYYQLMTFGKIIPVYCRNSWNQALRTICRYIVCSKFRLCGIFYVHLAVHRNKFLCNKTN